MSPTGTSVSHMHWLPHALQLPHAPIRWYMYQCTMISSFMSDLEEATVRSCAHRLSGTETITPKESCAWLCPLVISQLHAAFIHGQAAATSTLVLASFSTGGLLLECCNASCHCHCSCRQRCHWQRDNNTDGICNMPKSKVVCLEWQQDPTMRSCQGWCSSGHS